MKPEDVTQIEEIINTSFNRFVRFFALHSIGDGGEVLVAEAQEDIVLGFAKLITFDEAAIKYGCIFWIAVHPKYRLKGIASSLVSAGLSSLKDKGAKTVFASVRTRNFASLAVFKKQGFERMSFLKLWRLFGWRIFKLFSDIWLAPGEVALLHT
jgi:ribosomal protein S18 acetylase RimI-like enzyme